MVVYSRYVQPQSYQHTRKFANLWKVNFSLEILDSLVLTCLKPGTVYFVASCLLQRFSKDLLFYKILFLLGICGSWHEVLESSCNTRLLC